MQEGEGSGDGGIFGRQRWWQRKLRAAVAVVVEVANSEIVGEGSFRGVRRWRMKLWSSPSMVEGAAHGSNDGRGNCAKARPSVPSVGDRESVGPVHGDRGNDRGSVNGGGSSCARVYDSGSCEGKEGGVVCM